MGLENTLFVTAVFVVAMIGVPWLMFALMALLEGFPRLRIQQILGLVGVSAWVFGFLNSFGSPFHYTLFPLLSFTSLGVLLAFAAMWNHEFRLLMLRRAEEFTDPSDKRTWIFVLTVMAPAGVWLFRSFRKARWPEAAEFARPHPLDEVDS